MKPPPRAVFGERGAPASANHLRFRLSPDVSIVINMRSKAPGEAMVGRGRRAHPRVQRRRRRDGALRAAPRRRDERRRDAVHARGRGRGIVERRRSDPRRQNPDPRVRAGHLGARRRPSKIISALRRLARSRGRASIPTVRTRRPRPPLLAAMSLGALAATLAACGGRPRARRPLGGRLLPLAGSRRGGRRSPPSHPVASLPRARRSARRRRVGGRRDPGPRRPHAPAGPARGRLHRARPSCIPMGNVSSIAMPGRLGGGYLFHVNAGGGTEDLAGGGVGSAKLEPLARRSEVVTDIVPGFDRLYLRLATGNRVIALDARRRARRWRSAAAPLGELRHARVRRRVARRRRHRSAGPPRHLRRRQHLAIRGRPREAADPVGVVGGNLAVMVQGGRYVVDARRGVTHRSDDVHIASPSGSSSGLRPAEPGSTPSNPGEPPSAEVQRPGPLGKHPLPRRTVERTAGPDSPTTAVVGGAAAPSGASRSRTARRDGALVEDAYPEHRSTCHAVAPGPPRRGLRLRRARRGHRHWSTSSRPRSSMKPVMRFDEAPLRGRGSSNGAIVVPRPLRGKEAPARVRPRRRGPPRNTHGGAASDAGGDPGLLQADARGTAHSEPRRQAARGADQGLRPRRGAGRRARGRGASRCVVPPSGGSPGTILHHRRRHPL